MPHSSISSNNFKHNSSILASEIYVAMLGLNCQDQLTWPLIAPSSASLKTIQMICPTVGTKMPSTVLRPASDPLPPPSYQATSTELASSTTSNDHKHHSSRRSRMTISEIMPGLLVCSRVGVSRQMLDADSPWIGANLTCLPARKTTSSETSMKWRLVVQDRIGSSLTQARLETSRAFNSSRTTI